MASATTIPKVLFIGNSLTYFNNGLWTHVKVSESALSECNSMVQQYAFILWLQALCDAAEPPIEIATDKAVEPGATLSVLWGRPQPRKRIANGVSTVILQGRLGIILPF
jgi:hypothetical protein